MNAQHNPFEDLQHLAQDDEPLVTVSDVAYYLAIIIASVCTTIVVAGAIGYLMATRGMV